ncbi:hypothetical protein BX600DRAFT_493656 [Xylariales sp. PMI_506]|nr:hypothetical protein BX600DRAFT_493656 [Xylariales sp. PMI_506]
MADGLSLASSVAGLVSLGLQVYGGLRDYVDAVNARDTDLAVAKQRLSDFQNAVLTIQSSIVELEPQHQEPSDAVKGCLTSFEADLASLGDFLIKIGDTQESKTTLKGKLQDQKRKLAYPFHRSVLQDLECRLGRANATLQTALGVLGIHVQIASSQKLHQVESSIGALSHDIQDALAARVGKMQIDQAERIAELERKIDEAPGNLLAALISKPDYLRTMCAEVEQISFYSRTISNQNGSLQSKSLFPDLANRLCLCQKDRRLERKTSRWGPFFSFERSKSLRDTDQLADFDITRPRTGAVPPEYRIWDWILDEDISELSDLAIRGIVKTFYDNRASPTDVDQHGRSLAHHIANTFIPYRRRRGPQIWYVMKKLVEAGIENGIDFTSFDSTGRSPICYFPIDATEIAEECYNACADLMLSSSTDCPSACLQQEGETLFRLNIDIRTVHAPLTRSPALAEVWGCGPLSCAVLQQDEVRIHYILTNFPSTIDEVNLRGETPFHFAADKPRCMQLLAPVLQQKHLDQRDFSRRVAMDYALEWSGRLCRNGARSELCSSCGCFDAGATLINMSRSLGLNAFRQISHSATYDALRYTSQTAKVYFVKGLMVHREALKTLALQYLTSLESEQLSLSGSNVLDHSTAEVLRRLRNRGVDIPQQFDLGADTPRHDYSVYDGIYDKELAEIYYQHGFQDLGASGARRVTPIVHAASRIWRDRKTFVLTYLEWLVEHGADLKSPLWVPTEDKYQLLRLPILCFKASGVVSPQIALVKAVFGLDIPIHFCSCWCSDSGRTPFAMLTKSLFERTRTINDIADLCCQVLEICRPSLMRTHVSELVQMATFRALGATHTCCNILLNHLDNGYIVDDGYIVDECQWRVTENEEIQKLEESELETVQDLCDKFKQQLDSYSGDNPVGTLEDFFLNKWATEVEQAMNELHPQDDPKNQEQLVRELGIMWEEDRLEIPVRDYNYYEYYRREMEKIIAG